MTEEVFRKKLGKHIAEVRKACGYSQDKVYLEGSFSRGTLSKIERGTVSAEVYTLKRIADILDVPLKKLVDFE